MHDVGQNALCMYVRRRLWMHGAACLNSGAFPETWLTLTTPTRIPSSDKTILDGGSDSDGSGSLSPASAARVEELAPEINTIGKGKARRRSRPPCLHLSSLQYFYSLTSIGPSDRTSPFPHPSCHPSPSGPAATPPGRAAPRPTPPPGVGRLEGSTIAQRARTKRVAQDLRDKRQRAVI